ncbi:UbiA family prenyltransferase [Gilvimarinus sp. SDUM040013]|uniref:UbiA family prenyltransferase n=1 Tax=Gilvimarinus gilvus TaxID=3058038 RepID=A0ABU4S1U0_9GAMM|nr:UbiA family prenyltransferase [Gilvimarinus sp. SDUM040013]MDO3385862.1 UbiA family prenyltransferase [Gilvimarinus sp. SDUM040013]MDX6851155.1 UbiA family prenyltransferase [Gilvimarinus sp. SDUM040013]
MIKTALTLGRVSNLPTVWMNLVSASVLTSAAMAVPFSITTLLILIAALSCFYAGGMCLNDYCDRHWDAERQPYRPIPAGKIKAATVLSLTLGLFALGLSLLLLAPSARGIWAACGLLALIVAYDTLHKKHSSSVFLMATTRLGVYLVGAFAIAGTLPVAVLVIGLIQCIYTLLVTVVARAENYKEGGYGFPIIPWMIACMGLIDGVYLVVAVAPVWLLAGVATVILTRFGQRYVRGD